MSVQIYIQCNIINQGKQLWHLSRQQRTDGHSPNGQSCQNSQLIQLLRFTVVIKKNKLKYELQTVNSYNTSLFFSNQNSYDISDVQVLKITDTDSTEFDYYYMYGTTKTYEFYAYRSKNLSDWQPVTQMTGGKAAFTPGKENYCTDYLWAPEVIYDEKTDKYYMFYSGRNKSKTAVNGIEPLEIGLAVANEPYGPFTAYTDDIHDSSTPLFDGDKINESLGENDKTDIFTCIDPHPFVAQDGTKYLYFSRSNDPGAGYKQAIYGIKMMIGQNRITKH